MFLEKKVWIFRGERSISFQEDLTRMALYREASRSTSMKIAFQCKLVVVLYVSESVEVNGKYLKTWPVSTKGVMKKSSESLSREGLDE
jgi:hypothetical protein